MAGMVAAVLAVLLALALLRFGAAAFGFVAPRDAEAVPLLHVGGLAAGLALGVALLAAMPDPGDFRPGRVFAADGPWRLDLAGFLDRALLPPRASFEGMVGALGAGLVPECLLAWMAALGLGGALGIAAVGWRGLARLRAVAAVLLLAAWTALLVHYGAHLLAWLAAQLDVWVLAVLLVLFQRWRYGERRAH